MNGPGLNNGRFIPMEKFDQMKNIYSYNNCESHEAKLNNGKSSKR